jgi:CRISPR-associated protein Csd1
MPLHPTVAATDVLLNDEPYRLGRLFAVLANLHRQAMKGKGADLGDRRYSEAATTPAAVMGPLLLQAELDLTKIGRRRAGQLAGLIAELLPEPVPRQLSLSQQAVFALGYCEQRRALASPRAAASEPMPPVPPLPVALQRMAVAAG